jgi:RimJ/RimL family protein N-acetyltransferase
MEWEWVARGHGTFAVLDRAGGRFLGRAGLKYWSQFDETELGWVLRRYAWGQGYGHRGCRGLSQLGVHLAEGVYLTAMIHPDNDASIRLARRLGMAHCAAMS